MSKDYVMQIKFCHSIQFSLFCRLIGKLPPISAFAVLLTILGSIVTIPERVMSEPQRADSATNQQPNWILLYPQHPLYRKSVQDASQPAAIVNPTTPQPQSGLLPPTNSQSTLGTTIPAPNRPQTIQTREVLPTVPSKTAQAPVPAPLYIEPIAPKPQPTRGPQYFPGFSAGSPSGFGLNWGDVSLGLAYIDKSTITFDNPVSGKADGSAAIAFGLGNSSDFLGLEVNYNLISLTPSRFAANGSFDFKLHRYLGDLTSIAIGWENAINYGEDAGGTNSSVYGVVSKLFLLTPEDLVNPRILSFSVGVGGGRFRPFQDERNKKGTVGVFANIGYQVLPNVSAIVDWTGRELNLGVSYVPFSNIPFTITALAVDVAQSVGPAVRYALTAGFSFRFR